MPSCRYSYNPRTRRCRSKAQHERAAQARSSRSRKGCTHSRAPSGKCRSKSQHERAQRRHAAPALLAPGEVRRPYVKYAEFEDLLRMLHDTDSERALANIQDLVDFLKRVQRCIQRSTNDVRGCAANLARQGVGEDPYVAQVDWLKMMGAL